MTDLEKAARQALERLELLHPLTCHDTITALRRALWQQPDDDHVVIPVGYWHQGSGAFFKGAYLTPAQEQMRESGVLKPLYTRPQPAGEPVGHVAVINGEYVGVITGDVRTGDRIYRRPQPAAQWVGLDDSDMEEQSKRHLGPHRRSAFRDGWRSAEAKLKEKNT